MLAKDIMTRDVITVGPKATVREIAEILVEHKISGLPVVDGEGRVLGMVSEGDLMHKEIAPKLPDALSILGAIIYYSGLKEYQEAFRKMAASTAEEIMTAKVIVKFMVSAIPHPELRQRGIGGKLTAAFR